MTDNTNTKSIDVMKVFQRAWELYKDNFVLFTAIGLLSAIFGSFDKFIKPMGNNLPVILSISLFIGMLFFSTVLNIAIVIAVSQRYLDNKITLVESFTRVRGIFWKYINVSINYSLSVLGGLLLLLVPGVKSAVIYSIATFILIIEKDKSTNPMKESKLLVIKYFWDVFFVGSILLIPRVLINFIPSASQSETLFPIVTGLFLPFSATVMIVLYYVLKDSVSCLSYYDSEKPRISKTTKKAVAVIITTIYISTFVYGMYLSFSAGFSDAYKTPQITNIELPSGIKLNKPEGWELTKTSDTKYELNKIAEIDTYDLDIYQLDSNVVGISDNSLYMGSVGINEVLKNRIVDNPDDFKEHYGEFKSESQKGISLSNHRWSLYTLEYIQGKGDDIDVTLWKNYYTVVNSYILVVSYEYGYMPKRFEGDVYPIEHWITEKGNVVEGILEQFEFPDEVQKE